LLTGAFEASVLFSVALIASVLVSLALGDSGATVLSTGLLA
jgi:hypothetical protein